MGRAWGMDGKVEKSIVLTMENMKGRDHLENLGADGK
jgi:hypothetical protein